MSVIEYVQSSSGARVPVVDGKLLHSAIDPVREARQLVEQEWSRVESVQSLLVFGLGGGFHIQELLRRKNFEIIVVEAERELEQGVLAGAEELRGLDPQLVTQELSLRGFFTKSYALFNHPASYRLHSAYYAAVLRCINERTLSRLRELSQNHSRLSHFLNSLDICDQQIVTLPMVEEALSRRGLGLEQEGMIWMTMRELVV